MLDVLARKGNSFGDLRVGSGPRIRDSFGNRVVDRRSELYLSLVVTPAEEASALESRSGSHQKKAGPNHIWTCLIKDKILMANSRKRAEPGDLD